MHRDPTPTTVPAPSRVEAPTRKDTTTSAILRWLANPSKAPNPFEAPQRDPFAHNPWPWDGAL